MAWKHLVPALLLASLAIAASVVGTTEDEPVLLAPAHGGDQWTYVVQEFDNGTPVDDPVVRSFERLDVAPIIAADGGLVGGMAVRETSLRNSPCGSIVELEHTVVMTPEGPGEYGFDVGRGGCAMNTIVTGQGDLQDTVERYDLAMHAVRGSDSLPCGHTHDLAGQPLADIMLAAGDCGPLRLLGQDGDLYVFSDGNVTIGMDAAIPVPARIIDDRSSTVYVLDTFVAGNAEPVVAVELMPGIDLTLAPTAGGIPAQAPAMEFSIEAALAATGDDFRRVLDGGYLARADYETVRYQDGEGEEVWRTWYLAAADASTWHALRVRQIETTNQEAEVLPVWALTREARATIEVTPWDVEGPFPAQPAETIAMADLERAWRLHSDAPLDTWSVHHQCATTCDDAIAEVALGHRVGGRTQPAFSLASVMLTTWDQDTIRARGAEIIGYDAREAVDHVETTWSPPAASAEPDPEPLAAAPIDASGFVPRPVSVGITIAAIAGALLFLAKFAMALYHRAIPEHPLRHEILEIVGEEPGIHHKELMRRLDRGNHVVSHHVRRLVAADLVVAQAGTRFTCYFPKGKVDRRVMAVAPVLRSGTAQAFVQEVARGPGRNGQQLAAALGVGASSVTFHAKRLIEAGLVETRREGRSIVYHPTDLMHQTLSAGIAA